MWPINISQSFSHTTWVTLISVYFHVTFRLQHQAVEQCSLTPGLKGQCPTRFRCISVPTQLIQMVTPPPQQGKVLQRPANEPSFDPGVLNKGKNQNPKHTGPSRPRFGNPCCKASKFTKSYQLKGIVLRLMFNPIFCFKNTPIV